MGVVAMRGTFFLTRGGPLTLARDQAPLCFSDTYDGIDPHASQLVTQSDLTPFKPATDITFLGSSYTETGRIQPSWICGLTVGNIEKNLRVHGPRSWVKKRTRSGILRRASNEWELTEPESVNHVPLGWDRAYGGSIPAPDNAQTQPYEKNPIGCGIAPDMDTDNFPAPQIEAPDDPITDWQKCYEPQGLGPIPPFWEQRLKYAGTYDEAWQSRRHPLLPEDFNFRFWQCAHPDLIADGWLKGNEHFELRNLLRGYPTFQGCLPDIQMEIHLPRPEGKGIAPFVLDGVHFDMRPGVGRVFLTWRAGFPWHDGRGQPIIVARNPIPEGV